MIFVKVSCLSSVFTTEYAIPRLFHQGQFSCRHILEKDFTDDVLLASFPTAYYSVQMRTLISDRQMSQKWSILQHLMTSGVEVMLTCGYKLLLHPLESYYTFPSVYYGFCRNHFTSLSSFTEHHLMMTILDCRIRIQFRVSLWQPCGGRWLIAHLVHNTIPNNFPANYFPYQQ